MFGNNGNTKLHVETATKGAPIWLIGWLFTIGFAELTFWKGVIAVLVWPYFLGQALLKMLG